jgi:DHA1 family inner membrane transport protein
MNRYISLLPYWFLNFTIGFGWFTLSPILPDLSTHYAVGPASILLLISLYGYTMVAFALLSGYLSAKYSIRISLMISASLSVVGLIIRSISPDYAVLFLGQIIAASAYPLALGPVGALAQSINRERANTVVGVSVGILFLGMSAGALLTPYLFALLKDSISSIFLLDAVLAIAALVILPLGSRTYPREYAGRSLRGSFRPGMIKNWYVGLIISAFSVMFGGIASTALTNHHVSNALAYGGAMSGLAFLGSALGAIILPPLFERIRMIRAGMVITSALSLVSILFLTYFLAFTSVINVLLASFFMFGFFGNAFWSMAMTSTTRYVEDPAKAGFSTSMYSVATNLGVALIPTFFGVFFLSSPAYGMIITSVLVAAAFILSFFLIAGRITARSPEMTAS